MNEYQLACRAVEDQMLAHMGEPHVMADLNRLRQPGGFNGSEHDHLVIRMMAAALLGIVVRHQEEARAGSDAGP